MLKKLADIAEAYSLGEIYVFGSRAAEIAAYLRGESTGFSYPDSDVDIGLQPRRGHRLTARDKARLMIELEDLLGVRRMDLVSIPEAPPFLALDIIRGELIFSADPDEQAEHELYVLRRAGDLVHYERQQRNQILSV